MQLTLNIWNIYFDFLLFFVTYRLQMI